MGEIMKFPAQRKQRKVRRNADGFKYFTETQIRLIRRTARDAAILAQSKRRVTAIREWMLLDLLTSTGLRASEAGDIRCGDIRAGYGQSAVFVRCGKGSKSGTVQIPESLKLHLKAYLQWKHDCGESTAPRIISLSVSGVEL